MDSFETQRLKAFTELAPLLLAFKSKLDNVKPTDPFYYEVETPEDGEYAFPPFKGGDYEAWLVFDHLQRLTIADGPDSWSLQELLRDLLPLLEARFPKFFDRAKPLILQTLAEDPQRAIKSAVARGLDNAVLQYAKEHDRLAKRKARLTRLLTKRKNRLSPYRDAPPINFDALGEFSTPKLVANNTPFVFPARFPHTLRKCIDRAYREGAEIGSLEHLHTTAIVAGPRWEMMQYHAFYMSLSRHLYEYIGNPMPTRRNCKK
jgi:hypothetical protein